MPGYWGTRLAAGVYILFCIYVGMQALEFPVGGGTFPLFAEISAILISGIMVVGSFRPSAREKAGTIDLKLDYSRAKPMLLCALAVLYVFVIFELGYFASTILFLFAAAWLVGIRNVKTILLTAVILIPLMYGFFIMFLHAPLPKGILL
jgi:hypothetical protein